MPEAPTPEEEAAAIAQAAEEARLTREILSGAGVSPNLLQHLDTSARIAAIASLLPPDVRPEFEYRVNRNFVQGAAQLVEAIQAQAEPRLVTPNLVVPR